MVKKAVYDYINKSVELSQKTTMAPVKTLLLGLIEILNNIDTALKTGSISPAIYSFGDFTRIEGKVAAYIDMALVTDSEDADIIQKIEQNLSISHDELVLSLVTNLQVACHEHLL